MNGIKRFYNKISMVAATIVVATVVYSCKDKLPASGKLTNSVKTPTQIIDNMLVQQSDKGIMRMRMSAPLMERYERAKEPYDIFPKGINVKIYTEKGELETELTAKGAKHITKGKTEKWEAYGDVVVNNYMKGETMRTDTIYWDRVNKKIFTHCFVKLEAPDIFMQGIGMESDEMARNARILNPFDSYGVVKDSTEVGYIDTVNFIGPLMPKKKK
jgi:LPS export ABC transporter protein LptC